MAFDPSKPFEAVESSSGFDPSQPFETVDAPANAPHPVISAVKDAVDRYKASQLGAPQDLLERLDSLIRGGMDKAGEFATEEATRGGAGPKTAAGVGLAMQMAPDLAQTISPADDINLGAGLKKTAKGFARRALGFTKMDLKTPFAQKAADSAATVALENDVLPWAGSPKEALARAGALRETSGEALGAMREGAGASAIDPVFDSIEQARQKATNGLRGGVWDSVHKKFDEAQETLMALVEKGGEVSLKEVEHAKKLLGKTVNWMADNVSQETAKDITRAIEGGVENIMRSKGMDMATYEAQKRTYGATKTMEKVLTKRVSADQGNNIVSLPTAIGAAGQLATGNVGGAVATMGILEAMRRRGSSPIAKLLSIASDQGNSRVPPTSLAQLIRMGSSENRR